MPLANVRIVLIEPIQPGNIGAAARAMKNMGLSELRVVASREPAPLWMKALAVHAADIISAMKLVPTIEEALQGCGRVFGTTARNTRYRKRVKPPRDIAPEVVEAAKRNKVALVFGPEDRGLSNQEIRYCHELIRIPVADSYPSLNLAQAVMICCYELALAAGGRGKAREPAASEGRLAVAEQIERMFENLRESLLAIGFLNRENPDHIMLAIRRMLTRRGLEDQEVRIMLGIARQVSWYARCGRSTRSASRRRP